MQPRNRLATRLLRHPAQISIAAIALAALVAASIVVFVRRPDGAENRALPLSPTASASASVSGTPTPNTSRCRRPGTIDSHARIDVTLALQRFLASVPDGGCAVFPGVAGSARYRIDGAIVLTGRRHLTIYGNGAEFTTRVRGPIDSSPKGGGRSQRAMFQFGLGSDLHMQDVTIDGPDANGTFNAPYEEEAGIRLSGVARATLFNVSVSHVYGDAVSVYGRKSNGVATPSTEVLIDSLHARSIGRQGVAVTGANGVTVQNSDFEGVGHSVFDLEPLPRQSVINVRIIGNRVGTYGNMFLAGGGDGPKNMVYVGHNRATVPIRIKFLDGTHFTIEDNVGNGVARNPFVTGSGDDLRVVGNVQAFNGPGQVCPPNCGASALLLNTDRGGVCHAYAATNTFTAAQYLFLGRQPPSPCSWVDGGANVVGRPAPTSSSNGKS